MSGHNVKRPFIFSVRSFFSCLLYYFSLCSLPLLLLYILLLILFLSLDSPFSMPNFLHISIPFLLLPVLLHIFFLFPSTLHILFLVLVVSLLPSYSITYSSFLFLSSYSSSCYFFLPFPFLFYHIFFLFSSTFHVLPMFLLPFSSLPILCSPTLFNPHVNYSKSTRNN